MSITSVGAAGGCFGGGAAIGQPRLLLAVEHAGGEGEALPQLGDEGVAVGGVAHGARRDRGDIRGLEVAADLHVVADRRAGRLDRLVGQLPGEVDPPPEPRHPALPLEHLDAPVDVRDQQPRRVAAHVDHRHSLRGLCHEGPGTLERTPALLGLANRRGVEQPGSSSGS